MKPRFISTVGAYAEYYPDAPDELPVGIYDRVLKRMAVVIPEPYHQLIALESPRGQPFTDLEDWLNGLSEEDMATEGVPS